MQKRVSVLFATFLLFFTFVAFSWVFVPASSAAVQVGDKLSLFGDFRFRYEIDDEDDPAGDRERDRARIRARFGFKYDWSNRVNFGLRLRTESDNNQSPHQTLGVLTAGQNADFGLDRAYINVKYLDGGFAWLGKHGISWWEQNEAFWDADIQPEGAGLGYKFNFGEAGTFTLQSVFTYLTDNSFTGDGDGIFDDDTATSIQGVYNRKWGDYSFTVASGALFVADNDVTSLPGGSTTYSMHSFQVQSKAIKNFPITVGFDYLISAYDDSNPSSVDNTGGLAVAATAGGPGVPPTPGTPAVIDDANEGFVVNVKAKYQKWGFKFEYYDIELNAVPLQGGLGQDDFRYSSNFTGQKYQVSYDIGKGFQIDFRVYPQSRIDDSITSGSGFVMTKDESTRYQTNLNIKF